MNRFLFLSTLILGLITGCSRGDSSDGPSLTAIILSADKSVILADGKDQVVFSVKDNNGKDVTSSCKILLDGKELEQSHFFTNTPATYKIKAMHSEIVSNELTIVAVGENVKFTIKGDKSRVMADGGDFVNLCLLDEDGNNVTSLGEFYADGKKIEGVNFKTKAGIGSLVKITAKWNGKEVAGNFEVAVFANIPFVDRVLVESLTGTDCEYCQNTIKELSQLEKENDKVILLEVHISGEMYTKASSQMRAYATSMKNDMGATGTPSVYLDRIKKKWKPATDGGMGKSDMLEKIKLTGDIGIAVENEVNGDVLKVIATIGSKKTFTGKIVAVLVENGIMAQQTGMGKIEMYQMVRDYVPNIYGQMINVVSDGLAEFNASIPLQGYVRENCRLIVFVLDATGEVVNARQTNLGVSVGY